MIYFRFIRMATEFVLYKLVWTRANQKQASKSEFLSLQPQEN